MTRKRKLLLAVVGGLALLIFALLLYLTLSDLSGWRDTVARVASDAMGRELTIAGEFEVDLGIVTRVRATELSLANTGWGSEPAMASIDRLDGEINLWKLFSGSIHLPSVDIEGGRAIFESDDEAGSNWRLGTGDGKDDDTEGGGPVRFRIDRIRGKGLTLVFGSTTDQSHVDLVVDSLDSTGDAEGMHQLNGGGSLRGTEYTLSGRFGSFADLVNLDPFEHDLRGTLGSTRFHTAGSIGRIASLGDLDLKAEATIPNPTEIYQLLGLSYTFQQPLEIQAEATTASGLTDFTLTATGEAANLSAEGTIDSVLSPEDLDVRIEFAGPDIRPVAALAGIDDLPKSPFNARGAFRWRGFPVVVDNLQIEVGENSLKADGALGAPPLMLDTDFRFQGEGPNIASVAALAGLRFPPDSYELDGHVFRVENGLRIEELSAKIGRATLEIGGFVGDPPEYAGTKLSISSQGPNLAHYRSTFGYDLPNVPFAIAGQLTQGDRSIALDDVRATIGSGSIEVDGQITTAAGMVGTDLSIVTRGEDLSLVGAITGIAELPAVPFRAEGRATVTDRGTRLRKITGRLGDLDLAVDGIVTNQHRAFGTKLEVHVSGADLSTLDSLIPSLALPTEPFWVSGGLEVLENGLGLRAVEFEIEDATGSVEGVVGIPWGLHPTDLQIEARGPSLAVFDSLIPSISLPAAEFSTSGGLSVHDDVIDLHDTTFGVADNTIRITGTVTTEAGLIGSSLEASLESADLSSLGALVAEATSLEIPELPKEVLSLTGGLTIDEIGTHISALDIRLGRAKVMIAGDVGSWPDLVGTDLEIHADGPDASLIVAITGVNVPVAPFNLDGRIALGESGLRFENVVARLGEYRTRLEGQLGRLPKLIGTDLTVSADGPDLELLREFGLRQKVPSAPFSLTGHFEGNPSRFKTNALEVHLGSSDITGDVRIDLEGRPEISARLRSRHVRVSDFLPPGTQTETDPEQSDTAKAQSRLMISDKPWNLAFLNTIDLDLDWEIEQGDYLLDEGRDIFLSVVLEDGRLEVDRFEGTGALGGTVRGGASLVPVSEGHHLETEFHIDDGMVNLAGEGADPSQYTPGDLHIVFDAVGRSLHEIMASANGRVLLTIEGGVMKKGILDMVSADVLVTLLSALNPFAKDDAYTKLSCAVLAATFENGLMTLDPAAIQTDKVTVLGNGTLDFKTEDLRLDWITKPRKGIGISASMFTNPYIRLGGTMSNPAIEMKPAEALATTGVAVATMGISLIAKGMLDRITAEKKVCKQALKDLEKMEADAPER